MINENSSTPNYDYFIMWLISIIGQSAHVAKDALFKITNMSYAAMMPIYVIDEG